MTARLFSATIIGIDGVEVEVETDVRPAPEPHILIVGLPDAAVKESTQRVESAITNSSLSLPLGTIIINLAPADLKKQGPAFDLPMLWASSLALRKPTGMRRNGASWESWLSMARSVLFVAFFLR